MAGSRDSEERKTQSKAVRARARLRPLRLSPSLFVAHRRHPNLIRCAPTPRPDPPSARVGSRLEALFESEQLSNLVSERVSE